MPGRGGATLLTKVSWFRVIVTHPEGMRCGRMWVRGWRAENAPGYRLGESLSSYKLRPNSWRINSEVRESPPEPLHT